MIGIIGGIGPMAGLHLASRVVHFTEAAKDQDHFPMILFSIPGEIADRTEFLTGHTNINPGYALADQILKLEKAGATVAGMACNTAHAPMIMQVITRKLQKEQSAIRLIHLIDETIEEIAETSHPGSHIGILGTTGTYLSALYSRPLTERGFRIPDPGRELQERWIHQAVYHPGYGIKATGNEIADEAVKLLQEAVEFFRQHNCDTLLLGCSEIVMAINRVHTYGMNIIRPMDVLARALIREYKKSVFLSG